MKTLVIVAARQDLSKWIPSASHQVDIANHDVVIALNRACTRAVVVKGKGDKDFPEPTVLYETEGLTG